jgi:hypothetical protein
MMALAGLYAVGNVKSRADVQKLISRLVPGQAGQVDKRDILTMADKVAQYWPGEPPGSAQPDTAGKTDDDLVLEGAGQ